jgi:putative oxidoreductase
MQDATPFQSLAYNVLRCVAGFQLWQHGAQKLLAWFGRESPAELWTIVWTAGVIEFFGGALVAFGLFTRPVAFLLTGHMAVIFWWRHAWDNAWWATMNRGEAALLFCFIFMLVWAWGAGTWSIDAWRERRKLANG